MFPNAVLLATSGDYTTLPDGVHQRQFVNVCGEVDVLKGGNLRGVLCDVDKMQRTLVKRKFTIFKSFRSDVDPTLEQLFSELARAYEATQHTLVYFSGHSRLDGSWWLESSKEFVSPFAFLNHWMQHKPVGHQLMVIVDSCYSGAWVNAARAHELANDVVAVASSMYDEPAQENAQGGLFTTAFCHAQSTIEPGAVVEPFVRTMLEALISVPTLMFAGQVVEPLCAWLADDPSTTTLWSPQTYRHSLSDYLKIRLVYFGHASFVVGAQSEMSSLSRHCSLVRRFQRSSEGVKVSTFGW